MPRKSVKIVVTKKIYMDLLPPDDLLRSPHNFSEEGALEREIEDLREGHISLEDVSYSGWEEEITKVKVKK